MKARLLAWLRRNAKNCALVAAAVVLGVASGFVTRLVTGNLETRPATAGAQAIAAASANCPTGFGALRSLATANPPNVSALTELLNCENSAGDRAGALSTASTLLKDQAPTQDLIIAAQTFAAWGDGAGVRKALAGAIGSAGSPSADMEVASYAASSGLSEVAAEALRRVPVSLRFFQWNEFRGEVAVQDGDPSSAQKYFNRAAQLAPAELKARVLQEEGDGFFNLGMFASALAAYMRAMTGASNEARVSLMSRIANMYEAEGNESAAELWYGRAIAADPALSASLPDRLSQIRVLISLGNQRRASTDIRALLRSRGLPSNAILQLHAFELGTHP